MPWHERSLRVNPVSEQEGLLVCPRLPVSSASPLNRDCQPGARVLVRCDPNDTVGRASSIKAPHLRR